MALSAFSPAPTDANHVLYVDTVADMLALTDIRDGAEARTARYSSSQNHGDGSAGEYVYDANSTATIDGGFVMPGVGGSLSFSGTTFNGTAGTGRWLLKDQSVASMSQFGGTDGATLSRCALSGVPILIDVAAAPDTTVRIASDVTITHNGSLDCTDASCDVVIYGTLTSHKNNAITVTAANSDTSKLKLRQKWADVTATATASNDRLTFVDNAKLWDGNIIRVYDAGGGLPTGISAGEYYVVNRSLLYVQIATTLGGSPVDFSGDGTVGVEYVVGDEITSGQRDLNPQWIYSATDDYGERTNKCFQIGGSRTTVRFPSGEFPVKTTISMDETTYGTALTIAGNGFLATRLYAEKNAAICIIDAGTSDEGEIKDLRTGENAGSKTSIGFALGGTSLKIHDCWAGALKYGFYANKGSDVNIYDCYSELNDYGLYIVANISEVGSITGAPAAGGGGVSILRCNGSFFSGNTTAGIYIERSAAAAGTLIDIRLSNCMSWANGVGLHAKSNTERGIDGLAISACSFKGNTGVGIIADDALMTVSSSVFTDNATYAFNALNDAVINHCNCQFGSLIDPGSQTAIYTSSGNGAVRQTTAPIIINSAAIQPETRKENIDNIGNIDISQTFNFDSGNGDTKTATLTDDTAITLTATRPGMYWLLLRGDDGVTERLITWSTSVSGSPPTSVTSSTYTVIQLFWDGSGWHCTI